MSEKAEQVFVKNKNAKDNARDFLNEILIHLDVIPDEINKFLVESFGFKTDPRFLILPMIQLSFDHVKTVLEEDVKLENRRLIWRIENKRTLNANKITDHDCKTVKEVYDCLYPGSTSDGSILDIILFIIRNRCFFHLYYPSLKEFEKNYKGCHREIEKYRLIFEFEKLIIKQEEMFRAFVNSFHQSE